MSEVITDADREAAAAVDKMLACGCPGFIASIEKLFAAHRIAAANAERERWLVAVLQYANIANDKHTCDDLLKLIDQLTKGPTR